MPLDLHGRLMLYDSRVCQQLQADGHHVLSVAVQPANRSPQALRRQLGLKVGQIGHIWDKSRTLKDRCQYILDRDKFGPRFVPFEG